MSNLRTLYVHNIDIIVELAFIPCNKTTGSAFLGPLAIT